jgi:hypothetical protein
LKQRIDSNIDTFKSVVKQSSAIKGIRWDDIVTKFEYRAVELPSLIEIVKKATIGAKAKDFLIS